MKHVIFLSFLILFSACKKENKKRWYVEFSEFDKANYSVISNEICSESSLYLYTFDDEKLLFIERQIYSPFWGGGTDTKLMEMAIELPLNNHPDEFSFKNQELFDSLKCQAHFFSEDENKYYRLHNGWIKGVRYSTGWEIDFEVYFGENHYMKKGAKY